MSLRLGYPPRGSTHGEFVGNVFRNKAYRRLWFGQSISQVGDYLFMTTVALWIGTVLLRDKPYAPAVTGAYLVIAAAVMVCLAPVAGVFVDRLDKVRVALTADIVRAVASGGFAFLPWLSHSLPMRLTLTMCGVGVAVQAIASTFFNPARVIIVSDVVPVEKRGQAASFAQASSAIAMIAGPMLASLIFVAAGPAVGFIFNAVSFACSFVAIRIASIPVAADSPVARERKKQFGKELLEPLRLIGRDRVLRTVLGAGVIVMLGASTINSLNVYFVLENLHADPIWFGVISASLGAGLLVGSIGTGFLGERVGYERLLASGLLVGGLACLIYARLGSAVAAAMLIFLYGLAGGMVETVMSPLVLGAVRREYLGRVLSVFTPALRLSSVISLGAAGWLVSLMPVGYRFQVLGISFGRIDTVFVMAAVMFLLSSLYAFTALQRPASGP